MDPDTKFMLQSLAFWFVLTALVLLSIWCGGGF